MHEQLERGTIMEPLFMKPVFQEKIWGGSRLHSVFGFDLPSDKIGEDWAISAHPHGVSVIENGPFKGKTLADLWQDHQELFGHSDEPVFPLLIKIFREGILLGSIIAIILFSCISSFAFSIRSLATSLPIPLPQ